MTKVLRAVIDKMNLSTQPLTIRQSARQGEQARLTIGELRERLDKHRVKYSATVGNLR
jgi:hypothetical protein